MWPVTFSCDSISWTTFLQLWHFRILIDYLILIFSGTVNFSCTAAPSPVQEKASGDNQSIFDRKPCYNQNLILSFVVFLIHRLFGKSVFVACFWADCGGGSCNKTSQLTYSCTCAEGYSNLLNVSTFPCYKDCKRPSYDSLNIRPLYIRVFSLIKYFRD